MYSLDSHGKKNVVQEDTPAYSSREELEKARLIEAMSMSDMDKFRMFCKMMRIGKMLSSAKIIHRSSE